MNRRGILSRIGPTFIVGACIIGPGSVTVMSTTGANYGYRMIWLSLLAGVLMAGFLAIFMRFGICCEDTFLGLTAKKLGRWYAVLCGITLFSVDAAFQFGNALGVTAGMEALTPGVSPYVWPVAFTAAAIVFLFGFRRIYVIIERMMTFFLVFMVLAFLTNLIWAAPDLAAVARGAVVPTLPPDVSWHEGEFWVTIGGLLATTFVIVAAFLQPYLVKAKGWTEHDYANGVVDTVLASIMLTLIGAMIMTTAAAVLYKPGMGHGTVTFENMVSQLRAFGPAARLIFSIGFFAAAFSSFIANSMIGGVLLNDGLGLGGKFDSLPTKIFATCVLLVGMTTAVFIIHTEQKDKQAQQAGAAEPKAEHTHAESDKAPAADLKIKAIRVGQAATLLAVPLGTIAMLVVLFDSRAWKGRPLSLGAKIFVLVGAVVLLGIAVITYLKIQPELLSILGLGSGRP